MALVPTVEERVKSIRESIDEAGKHASVLAGMAKMFPSDTLHDAFKQWENISNDITHYLTGHFHNDHAHGCAHSFQDGRFGRENHEGYPSIINDQTYANKPPSCRTPCPGYGVITNPSFNLNNGPITAYIVLLKEYNSWIDADMNDYIFGKDFLFNPSDRNVPFEIKRIQMKYPIYFQTRPLITWDEYLELCPDQCPWQDRQI